MKIINIVKNIGIWISLSILIIISSVNIMFTMRYHHYILMYPYLSTAFSITSIIISIIILYAGYKLDLANRLISYKLKTFIIASIIITSILSILWILTTHFIPSNDSYNILLGARTIGTDDFIIDYFNKYPYNSGMLLYMLMFVRPLQSFMKIIDIHFVLEYLNIIPVCLTVLMLILITKELFNDETAKITAIITSLFITIPLTVIQVYGNILSLPLMLLVVYITIKTINRIKNNNETILPYVIKNSIITILLCFMIGAIKQNNIIAGIAITIVIILETITLIIKNKTTNKNENNIKKLKKSKKEIIACIIFMLIGMFTVPLMIAGNNAAIQTVETLNNRTFDDSQKNTPVLFIGMGLSDESVYGPGFFLKKIAEPKSISQGEEIAHRIINNRMNQFTTDPIGFISFFVNKIAYTWSEPAFSYATRPAITLFSREKNNDEKTGLKTLTETSLQKIIDSEQFNRIIILWLDSLVNIIVLSSLIGAFKNRKSLIAMMPAIIITGGFLFHLIWETQPEYAYTYFLLLIPYAAYGLSYINDKYSNIKEIFSLHDENI